LERNVVNGKETNWAIQALDVCVEFDNLLVLDDVTFSVAKGVFTGVVGPNGGGKSTLFNALVGIQGIAHGNIWINGVSPDETDAKISYVPQQELVNWRFPLTVKDVVSLGTLNNGSFLGKLGFVDDVLIQESLNKVDMWQARDHLVKNLSGGQRQRTFIARALAQKSEILLLDEAFSGVDVASQQGLMSVLKDLKEEGTTILVSTHDLNTLSGRFDEVLCINRHICAHGNPKSVFTEEVLTELYGSHEVMFSDHQIGQHGSNG
jgi:ABC-type Mn2+/Zn2+ transport system ATPase subunit